MPNDAFNFGVRLACINAGLPHKDLEFHKAASAALEDSAHPHYGVFDRVVCKLAAELYEQAGKAGCFEHCLYNGLSKAASWYPEFSDFTEPVFAVLGRDLNIRLHMQDLAEARVKEASAGALGAYALSKGLSWSPSLVEWLLGAGVAGGAGVGAASWALNRGATTDDADLQELKNRRDHYTKLTGQISDELAMKR
jgi:hypothetical protein